MVCPTSCRVARQWFLQEESIGTARQGARAELFWGVINRLWMLVLLAGLAGGATPRKFTLDDPMDHPFIWWPQTLLSYPVQFDEPVDLNRMVLTAAMPTGEWARGCNCNRNSPTPPASYPFPIPAEGNP
jgi:hypothetical protein